MQILLTICKQAKVMSISININILVVNEQKYSARFQDKNNLMITTETILLKTAQLQIHINFHDNLYRDHNF